MKYPVQESLTSISSLCAMGQGSGHVVAVGVIWRFRSTFWPGNYIWSFQIGFRLIWELSEFWYRGSTQNFEPDWLSIVSWPGKPFWKKNDLVSISKTKCELVGEGMEIHNFDKQSKMFKLLYLQFPPIQNSNSRKILNLIKIPHFHMDRTVHIFSGTWLL